MNTMDRRRFLQTGITGLAGITVVGSGVLNQSCAFGDPKVSKVKLGNTGLKVSKMAMGTGTRGYNSQSNQTRLGMDTFVKLAHRAYERGVNFFDMADMYGSHTYVGNAIKTLPREKLVLLSKIWTQNPDAENKEPVAKTLDRFRSEIGVDYIDILLMHCMQRGNWSETRKFYIDGYSKAKQDGIVKAVGVSCHHIDALSEAADSPWVDVIMARINPFGTAMDGSPDAVKAILERAKKNGKGIVGMKIFGEGKHVLENERQQSLEFAFTQGSVHSVTLGMESQEQMDDAIDRVIKLG